MTEQAAERPREVRIACRGAGIMDIRDMHELQGELKSLSDEAFAKLEGEILETGLAFPFRLWKDKHGKHWIIGGHQTKRVLSRLRERGTEVPPVPYSLIEAESMEQAKRRVLQDVAQYGRVEYQGLYEFINGAGIGPTDLAGSFVIPEVDMSSLTAEFYADDIPGASDRSSPSGTTEYESEEFSEFKHLCPRCGFHFDG